MNIQTIPGFSWPRAEDLIIRARTEQLTPDEQLAIASRSFYGPTRLAELCKGKDEINKRRTITNFYNVLRFLDTMEDANPKKLGVASKMRLINAFCYIMNEVAGRLDYLPIEDLIDEKLSPLTQELARGVGGLKEAPKEKAFVTQFGKGTVLRDLRDQRQEQRKPISDGVQQMATGMINFLQSGINTTANLETYCGYVAGDVGVQLTEIVRISDNVSLDPAKAKEFGLALQLTNILNNIYEDWAERRVVYLPKEITGVSNQVLFKVGNEAGKRARASTLEAMLLKAKGCLMESADYITSIPPHLTGYQAFTLAPYLAAVETLNAIRNGGPEAVFKGDKKAVKMPDGSMQNILMFVYALTRSDGITLDRFMEIYADAQDKENYRDFSFAPGVFEDWVRKL